METDAFFYKLFNRLPETLFELLHQSPTRARLYRFDSVELKKSMRIDGLFVPRKKGQPFYVVEVQYQRVEKFYANLFAKVFGYLDENDPAQEWLAVAIFPSRDVEPRCQGPYEDLLSGERVKRIYLDEVENKVQSYGIDILRLLGPDFQQTREMTLDLVNRTSSQIGDTDPGRTVIELVEDLLVRKYSKMTLEEVRKMFHLEDIRKTRAWQDLVEKTEEGMKTRLIKSWLTKGFSVEQISELLEITVREARAFVKKIEKDKG